MSVRNDDARHPQDKQWIHPERIRKGGLAAKLLFYFVGAILVGTSIWLWSRIFFTIPP